MQIKKLHDQIKERYESGEFTADRTNQGTSNPLKSIIVNAMTLVFLGLLIYFPITSRVISRSQLFYNICLVCFILNCIGLIFAIGYYYYQKKTLNRNR